MNVQKAKVSKGKRISSIWILPIIVFIIGSWVVIHSIRNQGPIIRIEFASGEGIVAEKTKIKVRSVDLGVVDSIRLDENFEKVLVTARMNKESLPMLTDDAIFWVVKPRVGAGGISGLGTVLSGAYIELKPGSGSDGRREFVGSDGIPSTPADSPGVRVSLRSDHAKSLTEGDPANYRGFRVGRVESAEFDATRGTFEYEVFIEAPYSDLVTTSTRFWNAGGVSIQAGADGLSISTSSLESILSGGVTFDLPKRAKKGEPIRNGHLFALYPNKNSVEDEPFEHYIEYLLFFDSSVRGLKLGSPVEYHGIKIGSVTDISFDYLPEDAAENVINIPVPVRIRIDPARLDLEDSAEASQMLREQFGRRAALGMRASLKAGNLLTGTLYVSLDFSQDANGSEIAHLGELEVFPTASTGLAQIEHKMVQALDKLIELPLLETIESTDRAIEKATETLASLQSLADEIKGYMSKDEMQQLPGSVKATLADLQTTLSGFSPESDLQQSLGHALKQITEAMTELEELAQTIKSKPNSLIFSGKRIKDPTPKASSTREP